MKYHINPDTGNHGRCSAEEGNCPFIHGDTVEEAKNNYERTMEEHGIPKIQSKSDYQKQDMLKKAVIAYESGFAVANKYFPDHLNSQLEFLGSKNVNKFLVEQHKKNATDDSLNDLTNGIYAASKSTGQNVNDVLDKDPIYKNMSDQDRSHVKEKLLQDVDEFEVVKTAGKLTGNHKAPFYSDIKKAIKKYHDSIGYSGYTPSQKKERIETNSLELADKMKISRSDLPEGVIAYDVETDTINGQGLNPKKAQITEIVMSTKEKTIVLSGDEKYILKEFKKELNNAPDNYTIIGWNNRGFDNIFVAERMKSHNLDKTDDNGTIALKDCAHQSKYAPAGSFENPQEMIFTKSNGNVLYDEDASMMLHLHYQDNGINKSTSMKPFVKSQGAEPIEVDRANMHLLTLQQRKDYVASDGISTMYAYKKIKDGDTGE